MVFSCFAFIRWIGGPYAAFGGRDASRGLATFNVTSSDTEEYDDLSDLDTMEMESVREWEMQFKGEHFINFRLFNAIFNLSCILFAFTEKYEYVGRLLRPGEEPNNYSDEEEDSSESAKGKTEDITNINSTSDSATASDKPKNEWLKSTAATAASAESNSNRSLTNPTSKSFASVEQSSNCKSNNNQIIGANGTNDQHLKQ